MVRVKGTFDGLALGLGNRGAGVVDAVGRQWPAVVLAALDDVQFIAAPIPEAQGKTVEGALDPHHVWQVSPGLSGMAFYDQGRFKAWQHNVFIGALVPGELIRLQLQGDKIVHEERLLGELKARIRDVRQGPDGYLYVLTDEDDGALYKVGLK